MKRSFQLCLLACWMVGAVGAAYYVQWLTDRWSVWFIVLAGALAGAFYDRFMRRLFKETKHEQ